MMNSKTFISPSIPFHFHFLFRFLRTSRLCARQLLHRLDYEYKSYSPMHHIENVRVRRDGREERKSFGIESNLLPDGNGIIPTECVSERVRSEYAETRKTNTKKQTNGKYLKFKQTIRSEGASESVRKCADWQRKQSSLAQLELETYLHSFQWNEFFRIECTFPS